MKIHDAMFQLDVVVALSVQEVQVPVGPLADVIAVAPPGFGSRDLSLALLIFMCSPSDRSSATEPTSGCKAVDRQESAGQSKMRSP
jgi:hypothetical protein